MMPPKMKDVGDVPIIKNKKPIEIEIPKPNREDWDNPRIRREGVDGWGKTIEQENIQETVNEINDGRMETWIINNHNSLINEFIEENPNNFKEFCETRWRETHER